ncbi:MAG TPA: hypothetical protein V6C97_04500 [Oculatellaceae cyanobacterium]
MDSGTEMTIALLAKKIDDQARFTRSVTIICTLSILGVMFYTLTEVFGGLPQAVVLHYMANIEPIVKEWKTAESNLRSNPNTKVHSGE